MQFWRYILTQASFPGSCVWPWEWGYSWLTCSPLPVDFLSLSVLDENAQLKEQIAAMQTSATQLEQVKNSLHQIYVLLERLVDPNRAFNCNVFLLLRNTSCKWQRLLTTCRRCMKLTNRRSQRYRTLPISRVSFHTHLFHPLTPSLSHTVHSVWDRGGALIETVVQYWWLVLFLVVRRELEVLQRTIQERNGEVRQLQKQLTDLERDKHTEVVKLRLEVYHVKYFYNM